MAKKKKWLKFRHRVITELARAILGPITRHRYNIEIEKFRDQGDRQYFVMMNHQTAFDQFFVGLAFKGPVYYIASEDLFSNGLVSRLIKYAVAPIPIKKQRTDVGAVMNCIRVAREGGTIAISPEGNRTYSGKTEYINPAIAPLVKKLKLPIALFKIEGGYGTHPRWSDTVRNGKMRAGVSRVIEPEEYKNLSDDELYQIICDGLYVNEAVADASFEGEHLAEYLERAVYVCPECGLSEFESHDDVIECKKCGSAVRYLPDKRLEGINCEWPFEFINDWYDYQCDYVNRMDTRDYCATPLYTDRVSLSDVEVYKSKTVLREDCELALYGDKLVIDSGKSHALVLPFDEIVAISVLGRNKLNVYHGERLYQIKSDKRFNALKYVNIFYRSKSVRKGVLYGEFLGL